MFSLMIGKLWLLGQQSKVFARLHSKIHSNSGDGLPPMKAYLTRSIAGNNDLPRDIKDKVLNFHPGQILLSKSGPIVIDWISAFQGDPSADVAKTLVLMKFANVPKPDWLIRLAINATRRTLQRVYLREYLSLRPEANIDEIGVWMIPIAAARLSGGIEDEKPAIIKFLAEVLEKADGACQIIAGDPLKAD